MGSYHKLVDENGNALREAFRRRFHSEANEGEVARVVYDPSFAIASGPAVTGINYSFDAANEVKGQERPSFAVVPFGIGQLRKRYHFVDKEEVTSFIKANPKIEKLLFETLEPIGAVFGEADLFLQVLHDVETEGFDTLLLSIAGGFDFEEAVEKLDAFDASWWANNIHRAEGKLTIDLGF